MGTKATASGWGTLEEDGKPACILREVELPVMSNEQCKRTKYENEMISENMMCAGYTHGDKDSCQVVFEAKCFINLSQHSYRYKTV